MHQNLIQEVLTSNKFKPKTFFEKKKSSRNYFSEFEIRENYLTFLHLEMSLERFQYMY